MSTASSGKSVSLLYGLLYGGVSIVFTVLLYLGGVKWFMSPVAYLGLIIPVLFAVVAAVQQKKQQGDYLEFSEALKTTFLVLATGALISTVFDYVLFNYIDVPFREALTQASMEKMEKIFLKMGMPQDKIDEETAKLMDKNNYTIGKLLLGFAFRCIGLFVLALIVAASVKKKRPMFENSFKQ